MFLLSNPPASINLKTRLPSLPRTHALVNIKLAPRRLHNVHRLAAASRHLPASVQGKRSAIPFLRLPFWNTSFRAYPKRPLHQIRFPSPTKYQLFYQSTRASNSVQTQFKRTSNATQARHPRILHPTFQTHFKRTPKARQMHPKPFKMYPTSTLPSVPSVPSQ